MTKTHHSPDSYREVAPIQQVEDNNEFVPHTAYKREPHSYPESFSKPNFDHEEKQVESHNEFGSPALANAYMGEPHSYYETSNSGHEVTHTRPVENPDDFSSPALHTTFKEASHSYYAPYSEPEESEFGSPAAHSARKRAPAPASYVTADDSSSDREEAHFRQSEVTLLPDVRSMRSIPYLPPPPAMIEAMRNSPFDSPHSQQANL
jgi:hypothetical protein